MIKPIGRWPRSAGEEASQKEIFQYYDEQEKQYKTKVTIGMTILALAFLAVITSSLIQYLQTIN